MQIIKNRSASYKDRKQKSSPIRTTKVSNKNEIGVTHYFPSKTKNSTANVSSQLKNLTTGSVRTGQVHPATTTSYNEPINQHANLLKSHNLSLNNFKTEIRLPHAQKFLTETQFVKSPFLSKTLKGMMQPKPGSKGANPSGSHATNYGRLGSNFQVSNGRRQREQSGHSTKSKRETSGSHKKGQKAQQKLFASKKLSFNQSAGKHIQHLGDILTKQAINTSKIYSRNEATMHMGPGHFLTTGDGILDKRYSNRSRQPKQTFYFSKKGRMNKSHQGRYIQSD